MEKRTDLDLDYFKSELEKEMVLLIEELKSVGRINPDNAEDWETKPTEMDVLASDSNEVADGYEAYGENAGVLGKLEPRFNNVRKALKNIEEGTYGFCETCNNPIEKDRLEANPSSTTCKAHM
ncbi:MAG: hypothetical protein GW939_02430 [Candidatus Magasanikbacteria bacterium]|nr:hypothetical protein [Candidatus Magasanikbacteria bacterium]